MYPFLRKYNNKLFIKLHKDLYKKDTIEAAKKEEPDTVMSVRGIKNYYLVELHADSQRDYLSFLNYLIYAERH